MSSYTYFLLTCFCACIISLLICSLTSFISVFTDLILLLRFILVYCHDGFLWPLNPGYWSWVMPQPTPEMICIVALLHSCIFCSIVSCSSVLCVPTVLVTCLLFPAQLLQTHLLFQNWSLSAGGISSAASGCSSKK